MDLDYYDNLDKFIHDLASCFDIEHGLRFLKHEKQGE